MMDLDQSIHQLLREIGPSLVTRSAYDTAWLARLRQFDEPIGEEALEWLRAHQLPDGSWGASELRYYHDRLICTLAAVTALARWGRKQDRIRWQRAQLALAMIPRGLGADPAGETVGFEMLVPTLYAEAEALGVTRGQDGSFLAELATRLTHYRAAKLASLPGRMINRFVTVAFSAEMVGHDGLHLLDVDNLQEENGSVACSPAATAFYALNVHPQDPRALHYLRRFVDGGAVPYVAPIDVFERTWPLWNLALAGPLDNDLLVLCQAHLDYLEKAWRPGRGVAAITELSLLDGDDTALTYEALARFGRHMDIEGVLHYEKEHHFRCYGLEANPSLSTNIHVLGALRQAGLGVDHPSVQKLLQFLRQMQTIQTFWFDKWHASPYYPTTHAIMACTGYADDLVDDAVYWILTTQSPDGSWGYYMPTAEETAYCLQALSLWRRQGHDVPMDVLRKGAGWLSDHIEPPYAPLWIGKCLYCPELVVKSAILSALALVQQE